MYKLVKPKSASTDPHETGSRSEGGKGKWTNRRSWREEREQLRYFTGCLLFPSPFNSPTQTNFSFLDSFIDRSRKNGMIKDNQFHIKKLALTHVLKKRLKATQK